MCSETRPSFWAESRGIEHHGEVCEADVEESERRQNDIVSRFYQEFSGRQCSREFCLGLQWDYDESQQTFLAAGLYF